MVMWSFLFMWGPISFILGLWFDVVMILLSCCNAVVVIVPPCLMVVLHCSIVVFCGLVVLAFWLVYYFTLAWLLSNEMVVSRFSSIQDPCHSWEFASSAEKIFESVS